MHGHTCMCGCMCMYIRQLKCAKHYPSIDGQQRQCPYFHVASFLGPKSRNESIGNREQQKKKPSKTKKSEKTHQVL